MPMNLRPIEIFAILLVVLLLFGAKRLPDLAKSVGRSLKIFKTEVKELREDDRPAAGDTSTHASTGTTATPVSTLATAPAAAPVALPDGQHGGTTPPHGDPALSTLPTDASDRKQV